MNKEQCPPCCDYRCSQGRDCPYNHVPLQLADLVVSVVAVMIFVAVVFALAGYVWGLK